MVTNFISLLLIINFCIQILGMKQQKSHARIHRVILELRQKSNHNESNQIQSINQKLIQNCRRSGTTTLQNSQILSQSQASSILLPESQFKKQGQSNFYKISNVISSESLCSQKEESEIYKRSIKTARPVSRRKVTSKDKYSKTVSEKQQAFKIDVKKSEVFEQLQILDPQYFFLEKEDQSKKENQAQFQQGKNIKAFWAKQHIFVSLFPIQYTECIVYHHANILPVYGQVMLNKKRFVVSNEYKNSSLKDLIRQFGPFQQSLCKKYLYQIVCGVEQMHSRKTAHNRLTTDSILYNKEGRIFINVVKSTSRAVTEKEKLGNLFQYCPEMILTKNKSNSIKSDVWSIGIILLDMLFDLETTQLNLFEFHPYNRSNTDLSEDDFIILDNIKQLYSKSFISRKTEDLGYRSDDISIIYDSLSQDCKDLIKKCLEMNKQHRGTIKMIKSHAFFSQVREKE